MLELKRKAGQGIVLIPARDASARVTVVELRQGVVCIGFEADTDADPPRMDRRDLFPGDRTTFRAANQELVSVEAVWVGDRNAMIGLDVSDSTLVLREEVYLAKVRDGEITPR